MSLKAILMWRFIDEKLLEFKGCFNRQAAFKWFVIVVIGLMIRTDHLGVTSIIRALGINPHFYESIIHFFHASSWKLETIRRKWLDVVMGSGLVYRVCDKPLLIGDGVKETKEGRKIPCVKKLVQESENSSKPQFMHGHMFGAIGILLGNADKLFCTLLSVRLHDGNDVVGMWAKDEYANESHVVRIIRESCEIAANIGASILTLDSYYLTVPALTALIEESKKHGKTLLGIVTKAKKNAVAYEKPTPKSGRGRPPVKGASVKLMSLFTSCADRFQETSVTIYGKQETVEFFTINLLWGQKLYQELKFVLVKIGSTKSILVSTDLTLSPKAIIEIYSLRFKVECSFREFKQVIAGFAYRFWTSAMPKLNRFAKNCVMNAALSAITDINDKASIVRTWRAIEGFTMFAVIAFGIIQMTALRFGKAIGDSNFRWLRTKRNDIPSEATTVDFMRKTIFNRFYFSPDLVIARLIDKTAIPSEESRCSLDA